MNECNRLDAVKDALRTASSQINSGNQVGLVTFSDNPTVGEVNTLELEAIAALRETPVYQGTPDKVQLLLKDLFQTNL